MAADSMNDDVKYSMSTPLEYEDSLREDNKDIFLSHLRSRYKRGRLPRYVAQEILSEYCGIKCVKALLEEDTGFILDLPDTVDDDIPNFTPLHSACEDSSLALIHLLLRHGADPNIRCTSRDPYARNKQLPLDAALTGIKNNRKFRYCDEWNHKWNLAKHAFRVIIALCLPEMKYRLKVIRLLVERTKEVEKEIHRYFIEGKVIEVAALLIVAREKVMSPLVFESLCDADLEGSMNVASFIMEEIMTLENLKLSCVSNGRNKFARKFKHQLDLMMPIVQLLEIFGRVGDRIDTYLKEQPRIVSSRRVTRDIASIFLDAGFPVKQEDYDIGIFHRIRFDASRDPPYKLDDISSKDISGKLKTPAAMHAKLDSTKKLTYVPASFKHGAKNIAARSIYSMAVVDGSSTYDRLQSLTVELEKLCNHEYLKEWSPRKSIFTLIYILCLSELQGGLLKSIRTLALESKDIGEFCCLCLKEGKLVELAVLLMVAHQRLIGKTTPKEGAPYLESSMGLCEYSRSEMASAIYEETISRGTFQSSNLVRKCKARTKLMSSARLLIEVFERKGNVIERYLRSDLYRRSPTNVEVAEDVAYLLNRLDTCFWKEICDMKCFSRKLELKPRQAEKLAELNKRVPVKDGSMSFCSPVYMFPLTDQKKHVSRMLSGDRVRFPIMGAAARSFHTCAIPDNSLGSMTSKSTRSETMEVGKPLIVNNILSGTGRQLTMFALTFKRGPKH